MSSRQDLLRLAFCDLPSSIGEIKLRPLSAGSYVLLQTIGNLLVSPSSGSTDASSMAKAVIEYAWLHHVDEEKVAAIEDASQIPASEIRLLSFKISFGECFDFMKKFAASAQAWAASMAEPEEDIGGEMPGKPESSPTGSPSFSSSATPSAIPSGSDTSSGGCPSDGPLPLSTVPTSPMEPSADGPALLVVLDDPAPETSSSPSSSSENSGLTEG